MLGKLTNLPQNYGKRLALFYGTIEVTARQKIDKITYFRYLEEVDNDDVKMRIIAQSFLGEVKKWFKAMAPGSVQNSQQLIYLFLVKWEERKNHVQILVEYK